MSTENETTPVEPANLTINDPLDAATLKKMGDVQLLKLQLAERLADLEQEKVRVLRALSNVDVEKARLFETINVSRGLPPNFPVEIDAKTGLIKPLEPIPEPAKA